MIKNNNTTKNHLTITRLHIIYLCCVTKHDINPLPFFKIFFFKKNVKSRALQHMGLNSSSTPSLSNR